LNTLTHDIARFVHTFDQSKVPPHAYQLATTGIIDCMGCMFAGAHEPLVQVLRQHFTQTTSAQTDSSIPVPFLGASFRHTDAACLWAAASHALDYDDVAMSAHPSTVLMPAVMTAAWALSSSGADVLNAYIIGYEIWAELFGREPDPYHLKGWHPTAVFGTVAAAGALAYLYRLDQQTTIMALGIAASMASGLVANFGTMTKPYHAGRAAANAVEAVQLARLGLTACADVFEHKAGFLNAISPGGRVDINQAMTSDRALHITESGLNIKRYPVCYSSHRIIDGMLTLVQQHRLTPEAIASIDATIGRPQASMLRNPRPVTKLEAKFSLEFAIAAALLAGKVGLAELSDAFVNRAQLQAFYPKIRVHAIDDPDPADPAFAMTDRLCVTLTNGTTLDSGPIRYPSGHARLPLTRQQLQEKFMDCVANGNANLNTNNGHSTGNANGDLNRNANGLADRNATPTAPQAGLDRVRARQLYKTLDRLPDVANIRVLFAA